MTKKSSHDGLTKGMKEAIERSGYLFEQRLVPVIETAGYKATANHWYPDPDDDSLLSELDIYAISAREISPRRSYVWLSLLIEYKNLRCPLVFFTQREIRMPEFLGSPHFSGIPRQVVARNRAEDFEDYLRLEDFHHYYSRAKTVSQFCAVYATSEGEKKVGTGKKLIPDDYIAGHKIGKQPDIYSDGIVKLVQAVRSSCDCGPE